MTQYGYNVDTNVLEWVQYPEYTSSKKAVRSKEYTITKSNGLLPTASYTFDAYGRMIDPPDGSYGYLTGTENYSISYQYDASGMRNRKTITRTDKATGEQTVQEYTYVYNGGNLSQMTVDGHTLRFSYDSGKPMFIKYDSTTFQYVLNLQGDVIAIVNSEGAVVVEYAYDAWGNVLSVTGSHAFTLGYYNPLRYRGYVYDYESGLYYLQSRYYNPTWGRFLNADAFIATGQGFVGNNMFAYCLNNPANAIDPLGEDAIWLQELNNPASSIAGHTALLIQDAAGNWYYFNWNGSECTLSYQGKIYYDGMSSLPSFIRKKYDRLIYFKGNFSASVDYARTLKKKYSTVDYDVLWNNCMQVSADVLMRGKFAQSNSCYRSFLQRVRNSFLPNVAYSRMVNFHNAVKVYYAAPKWARWLYTSPEEAVWMY